MSAMKHLWCQAHLTSAPAGTTRCWYALIRETTYPHREQTPCNLINAYVLPANERSTPG